MRSRRGDRPPRIVDEQGLAQVSDAGELGAVVDEIIAAHPDEVAAYKAGVAAGDPKAKKKRGFFFGQVMAATDRKANPKLVNQLLDQHLES